MRNTVLITGATGQDARYLAHYISQSRPGTPIVLTHRTTARVTHKDKALDGLDNITYEEMDLLDGLSVKRIINEHADSLKQVYHLAAFTHVGKSYYQPELCMQTNIFGTQNLFQSLVESSAKNEVKVYNALTSELFDGKIDPQESYNENSPMNPRTPYGISKLAAFHLGRYYRDKFNLHVGEGILFNHESPLRGQDFVTQKIATGFARIKKGLQSHISLGNLNARRDWGFAGDYVKAMTLICDHGGTYVVATNQTHSVLDFCNEVFRSTGLPGKAEDYIQINPEFIRSNEVETLRGDYSKIHKDLGWSPTTSFESLAAGMYFAALDALCQ